MPGCSRIHQLIRFAEFKIFGFDKKITTVAAFLGYSKAYDSIWNRALIYKLVSTKFPVELTRLIDSFLGQI